MPNESRTALELFEGDYETASFQANGYYAYDDFVEFARRLGLVEKRFRRMLHDFVNRQEEVFALIDRSALPEDCKRLYKDHVQDSVMALNYSYAVSQATD